MRYRLESISPHWKFVDELFAFDLFVRIIDDLTFVFGLDFNP